MEKRSRNTLIIIIIIILSGVCNTGLSPSLAIQRGKLGAELSQLPKKNFKHFLKVK